MPNNGNPFFAERERYIPIAKQYVSQVLAPKLGCNRYPKIIPALFGRRNYVYFLEFPEMDPMVLRFERDPGMLVRRMRGHEILADLGLNVPAVLYCDISGSTFKKFGFYFFLESFVVGDHYIWKDSVDIFSSSLAKSMVKMHKVISIYFGWPKELSFYLRFFAGLKLMIKAKKDLRKCKVKNRGAALFISDKLAKQSLKSWFPRPRLTIGSILPSNILFDGKELFFIDLARVRYGIASRDIAQIKIGFFEKNRDAVSSFLLAYKKALDLALLKEIESTLVLSEILFVLRLICRNKDVDYRYFLREDIVGFVGLS